MVHEGNLAYHGEDPGAVQYGNFINYYSFHNSSQRIQGLHASMFPELVANEDIICLDIGCNTGELTKGVYDYLKNNVYPKSSIRILGVDIDPILIQRAKDNINISDITFINSNIMKYDDQDNIAQFLKSNNRKKFDIVFCFSVTMWLHLNSGDEDFLTFLKSIKDYTNTLIIEPQPWKCYRNAQRRMKKSGCNFPLYETLKIRSNVELVIEDTLIKNGLIKTYESPPSNWNRKIQSFHSVLK